eukprot:comp30644_c0_seq1/m.47240 comp30644_c0_seq1/g.47240  ORF comp30644_c0_seq1/g.47240 comp30644_c0_seq1/m.47240 type:complete len:300 (-) comp30644_c0_seq1:222-1121(-)
MAPHTTANRRPSQQQMNGKQLTRLRNSHALRSLKFTQAPVDANIEQKFKCLRRDIQIRKPEGEDFGAYFTNISGRVVVCYVSEYPLITSINLFTGPGQSAAFRAGLSIGSEIISVNGDAVGDLEDYSIRTRLAQMTDMVLEIKENALTTKHEILCKRGVTHGIQEYSDSEVVRVREGSPADAAGIKPGNMIVSVAGCSTFGMADRAVLDLISTMVSTSEPFTIETMTTFCGIRLLCDSWRIMEAILPNVAPFEMIDADYQTSRLEVPYHSTSNLVMLLFESFSSYDDVVHVEPEPAPAA